LKEKWGLGIGDWGLGIGDWGLVPIPNPQSPIPNPHIHFILKHKLIIFSVAYLCKKKIIYFIFCKSKI